MLRAVIYRMALRVALNRRLRRVVLPLFARLNPGDVTIRHHWTGEQVCLHAFRHKGYWFHGRNRELRSLLICRALLRAGDVVFDVGAHIGYTAMYFASLVGPEGKVFAFEPGADNLPYIRRNVQHAKYKNIVLVEKAVGADNGLAPFLLEDITGQNNSLIEDYPAFQAGATSHNLPYRLRKSYVEVLTLDRFTEDAGVDPNFIKIDVEGAEHSVLQGMRRILAVQRPVLMIEITSRAEQVFEELSRLDYSLFDEEKRMVGAGGGGTDGGPNFFALPAERVCVFTGLGQRATGGDRTAAGAD